MGLALIQSGREYLILMMLLLIILHITGVGTFTPFFELQYYKENGQLKIMTNVMNAQLWIVLVFSVPIVVALMGVMIIPAMFLTAKVLAGVSIGIDLVGIKIYSAIYGEFWLYYCLFDFLLTTGLILFKEGRRVKKFKNRIEIYLHGKEYKMFLIVRLVVVSCFASIILLFLKGVYSASLQIIWNVLIIMYLIIFMITKILQHHRIVVLDNNTMIYAKYKLKGQCRIEEMEVLTDSTDTVTLIIKQNIIFQVECRKKEKELLKNLIDRKNEVMKCEGECNT